jgi:hypothetical protein
MAKKVVEPFAEHAFKCPQIGQKPRGLDEGGRAKVVKKVLIDLFLCTFLPLTAPGTPDPRASSLR